MKYLSVVICVLIITSPVEAGGRGSWKNFFIMSDQVSNKCVRMPMRHYSSGIFTKWFKKSPELQHDNITKERIVFKGKSEERFMVVGEQPPVKVSLPTVEQLDDNTIKIHLKKKDRD